MGSPPTGKCVLEGKTLRKQQAPRPPPLQTPPSGRIGLYIAGLGGLGKFFSPPLFWNYFLGNHWRGCAGVEALQGSLVSPVVRGTLLPRFAAPHVPLRGTCFFLSFALRCFC